MDESTRRGETQSMDLEAGSVGHLSFTYRVTVSMLNTKAAFPTQLTMPIFTSHLWLGREEFDNQSHLWPDVLDDPWCDVLRCLHLSLFK